jgi:uridine kinase
MKVIIGVSGYSGSGKTTFTKLLAKRLTASVILQDDFYIGANAMVGQDSFVANFDTLTALNTDQFLLTLIEIKNGNHSLIQTPNYNYLTQSPDGFKNIALQEITLVEGHLIFTLQNILDLVDFNIYIDIDRKTAKTRRFTRDVVERGFDKEECEAYYNNYVIQTLDTIESLKYKADFVIDAKTSADTYTSQIEKMLLLLQSKGGWYDRG